MASPASRLAVRLSTHSLRGCGRRRWRSSRRWRRELLWQRWVDMGEMVAELRKTRARTMEFVAETQADLRGHFFPHIAFGDLDCYQWLVVLGQHGMRHALQIEEIKADPAYPTASRP